MGTIKTAVMVIVWEFIVGVLWLFYNTVINGIMVPVMNDTAGNLTFIDQTRFQAGSTVITSAGNVAFFIFILLPFIYLFVRLLFKKEQVVAQPYPSYPTFLTDVIQKKAPRAPGSWITVVQFPELRKALAWITGGEYVGL